MRGGAKLAAGVLAMLAAGGLSSAQRADTAFTNYAFVKPVLEHFSAQLPMELAGANQAKWDAWNRSNDKAIRARLDTGDLDSMVNLLLFGTSFTSQPRIAIADLAGQARGGVLGARVADLVRGLTAPGTNERLSILRGLLIRKGIRFETQEDTRQAGVFILQNLTRVLEEKQRFAARSSGALESSKNPAQADSTLLERSGLFRDRGVSLDTGILANFSVDLALSHLKQTGELRHVSRIAVIGPGLAFIDKDESGAFDYFPPQTVQPFAVIDSLLRLGPDNGSDLSLTALDISPLVLEHLQRARQQAAKGAGYSIQLPQDTSRSWPPELEKYWSDFGDRVGGATAPLPLPAVFAGLRARAVRIRPEVVLQIHPVDFDMVAQSMNLRAADRFDLVVATNVFLYYDAFQQALALQNVSSLLKPGALLLANDELPLLPSSGISRMGVSAVSDGGAGRDTIAFYRKQ
jgi:SAM-dependent methyltransferase